MSFKTGDQVLLKSGGPAMTVSEAYDTYVMCSWFNDGYCHHDTFAPEMLELVDPDEGFYEDYEDEDLTDEELEDLLREPKSYIHRPCRDDDETD